MRTKRSARPTISLVGQQALDRYEHALRTEVDLRPATIRNYLSDLGHFAVWCEVTWSEGQEALQAFMPTAVATPTLLRYRTFLQETRYLKPASVNRSLISLKRYFAWAL